MSGLKNLISIETEIKKIDEEAERQREAVRAKLAEAITSRKIDIAEIAERVGALTLGDELIGGALLMAIAVDTETQQAMIAEYRGRFPSPKKSRRGRPPKAKPAITNDSDERGATVGAATQAGEPQTAERSGAQD